MDCMGQTDGGMDRHREGQDRQTRARTAVWAYREAKGCVEGQKDRQGDIDEQVGHKDGQMDRYMRHMDRQTGIQTDRCTDEMDNIELGAQRGERNS